MGISGVVEPLQGWLARNMPRGWEIRLRRESVEAFAAAYFDLQPPPGVSGERWEITVVRATMGSYAVVRRVDNPDAAAYPPATADHIIAAFRDLQQRYPA